MIHGENSTVVQYSVKGNQQQSKNLKLELRPLISFRDYHNTTHANGAINPGVDERSGSAGITPYQGLPALHLAHNAVGLKKTGDWYRNFEYDIERERGLDFTEDLFNPLVLSFELQPGRAAEIIASTEPHYIARAAEYRQDEINRRQGIAAASPSHDEFVTELVSAADQFIVSRGDQKTVIAGYHWFSDWGR